MITPPGAHGGTYKYPQRTIDPNANRIVRREKIADGITRVYYADGGQTDICVSNEPGGPMDFQGRMHRGH